MFILCLYIINDYHPLYIYCSYYRYKRNHRHSHMWYSDFKLKELSAEFPLAGIE